MTMVYLMEALDYPRTRLLSTEYGNHKLIPFFDKFREYVYKIM